MFFALRLGVGGICFVLLLTVLACHEPTPVAFTDAVSSAATTPELPRLYVDTKHVPPSGRTIAVRAGGNFQAALNKAQPGDVIILDAGATFTGPFRLPKKRGDGWITIRTSATDSRLPPPGTRVDPSYATAMPKLEAASGSVLTAAPGAHHYRFIGIEVRPRSGVFLYNLVLLGSNEKSEAQLPHHIILDRCYLHGDSKKGTRRGIAMNGKFIAVIDSHLSDFKEVGADSQAIAGLNGPGPFKIVNNYLEGAGENVLFGGVDPLIPNLVPSDIEIRRNHFFKPLSWKIGDPGYAGTPWTVKNLFELKSAQRVLVEGNVFESNWIQAQTGYAVLFTVRNQDGKAPWSVVQDVTFRKNILRNTDAGVNIHGFDNNFQSQQTKRILIQDNLFDRVKGRLFMLVDGTADIVIDQNTLFHDSNNIIAFSGPRAHTGFVYRNSISNIPDPMNFPGVMGDGTAEGIASLDRFAPGYIFVKNVLQDPVRGATACSRYPPDNVCLMSWNEVQFVDKANCNYRLQATSPYKSARTDGRNIGAEIDAIEAATARAICGYKGVDKAETTLSRAESGIDRTERSARFRRR